LSNIRLAIEKVVRKLGLDFDQAKWGRLLQKDAQQWREARQRAQNGAKILIATSTGGHTSSTTIESLLAVALTLRGAEVHVLLCDELLPACMLCSFIRFRDFRDFVREGPQKRVCWDCFSVGYRVYKPMGLPIHGYSEFVTPEEMQIAQHISETVPVEEIGYYTLDGLAVGEHALAGALRFFARGTLDEEPTSEGVLRRYFRASLLTTFATRRLVDTYQFTSACFNHGIYVPQGLVGEVMRAKGARVINWNPGYRKKCFIFSHHDTYPHTLLSEPVAQWENVAWSDRLEADVMDYLRSRWQGSRDWIQYLHKNAQEDIGMISRELGVDFAKPTIGMLTNVMWDAQLHYPANAFPNILQWVLQTIQYFANRPELQLVIRVHPAELTGLLPSRQPIVAEIHNAFPNLPANVFLIPPESRISTYAVAAKCNAVIIYGTKTGVELTSIGIPVIVAGEAWIRNKGITLDASSSTEYFELLDRLPLPARMDEATIRRARMYAYHFFFRRMIPIQSVEPASFLVRYRIQLSDLNDLLPGRDPGLDIICNGILHGSDFVYPAESYAETE